MVINRKVSEIRKRGFEYERGRIVVYIFRVDQVSALETNAKLITEALPFIGVGHHNERSCNCT